MAIILTQTDTAAACGTIAACSGLSVTATPQANQAVSGGTAGSTPLVLSIGNKAANEAALMFEGVPGVTSWAAGTYTVRLNLTTAADTQIVGVYVCRLNSSCSSLETLGSSTGLSIDCNTTGVKTINVTGSSTTASATDKLYIVVAFTNNGTGARAPAFTPDQNIDTPIVSATTHQAAMALTVTATQTSGGSIGHSAAITLSVTATQVAAGSAITTHEAAASLLSAATLIAPASLVRTGAAVLGSTANLAGVSSFVVDGSSAMASSASLSAAGERVISAAVAMASTATLTGSGSSSGSLTAQAALGVTSTFYPTSVAVQLSSELPGNADYYVSMDLATGDAGALQPHHFGVVARAADTDNGYLGYYDADLMRWVIAKMVSGDVTVLASYSEAFTNARLRLTVIGDTLTLYADGVQKVQTTDSTFTAAGQGGVYARKFLASYGVNEALQGDNFAIYSLGAQTHAAAAVLASTASLSSTAVLDEAGVAQLNAVASLSGTPQNIVSAACTMACTTTVTAIPRRTIPAVASLSALATMSGTGTFIQSTQVLFASTGTVTAIGTRQVTGIGLLAAAASLAATPSKTIPGSAALGSTATLNATASFAGQVSAALQATASLVGTAQVGHSAAAALSSTAVLTATAVGAPTGSASLASSAALAASGSIERNAASSLTVTAGLTASPRLTLSSPASLTAHATLSASAQVSTKVSMPVTTVLLAAGSLTGGAVAHLEVTTGLIVRDASAVLGVEAYLTTLPRGMLIIDSVVLTPMIEGSPWLVPALDGEGELMTALGATLGINPVMDYNMVNIEPAIPLSWDWLTWEER